MIYQEFTLREYWTRKANEYYQHSRDNIGVPSKTLTQCYLEVMEDLGPIELDQFNTWWNKYIKALLWENHVAVWADGTYDGATKACAECGEHCSAPVSIDRYREIKKAGFTDFNGDSDGY